MARPPKLEGRIPTVRADWQWSGSWWVEIDALLTGAWRLPKQDRLALLMVNVSEKPVTATLALNGKTYGLPGENLRVTRWTPDGPGDSFVTPSVFRRDLNFPPREAWAWELTPEKD